MSVNLSHLSVNSSHLSVNASHLSVNSSHLSINSGHLSSHLFVRLSHFKSGLSRLTVNSSHCSVNYCHVFVKYSPCVHPTSRMLTIQKKTSPTHALVARPVTSGAPSSPYASNTVNWVAVRNTERLTFSTTSSMVDLVTSANSGELMMAIMRSNKP